jgi:hypothetical protein
MGVRTDGEAVTISVGVVEIYPDSFTMEARIRPAEGEGIAARSRASLEVAVTDRMKDEFIALAHAAREMH